MHQNEYLWSKGLTVYQQTRLHFRILEAFGDEKVTLTVKQITFGRIENMVGKGEMVDRSIFYLYKNVYKKWGCVVICYMTH